MNVERFIKEEAIYLKDSRRKIQIAPEIDTKHLDSIRKKYKNMIPSDFEKYVLVLSYTGTGFFLMTGDAFYFDNFMQGGMKKVQFRDISSVNIEHGKTFSPDKVYLNTTSEKFILDGCIDGLNLEKIKQVFLHIINMCKENSENFTVSEQGMLSSELPDDLKLVYLKILCNYAYINDSVIDADEYNAITKFSIRMELSGESRGKLRIYMNDFDNRIKTGILLARLMEITKNQTGFLDIIKYCLMQDVLYIHSIQSPDKPWTEDGFIGSLMEKCALNPEQIETMQKAVKLNQQMQLRGVDMDKLKEEWKKLIKAVYGTKGYVPTPYLFCSGSVYGHKSYNGFFKIDATNQNAINKQRELILQEIIINNQKAVNVVIGDMNYLAERLEKALENEDRIQQDYEKIKQLLNRIKSAMKSVRQEEECRESMTVSNEIQEVYNREKEDTTVRH